MAVQYYHDRVEFQARGHPHIHGLAWSKMDKLETSITGLKLAFQKLKQQQNLGSEDVQALRLFIDSSVSCSRDQEEMMRQFTLSAEDVQVVIDRVSQVNVHHHTKTCRKNGTECRFDIPRFPSKYTIVAQGMPEHVKNTEKEAVTGISYVQKRVKTVMKELELDRDERRRNDAAAEIDIDLPTLLERCFPLIRISDNTNIITISADENSQYNFKTLHVIEAGEQNQDSDILISTHLLTREKLRSLVYHYCLTVCDYGTKVILKRNVPDIFVNNYNPHWMLAWNGNMDLQICLDYFSIITYMTDYVCKPETKTTELLKEVKKTKEKEKVSTRDLMYSLAQAYLTSREMGECEAYYKLDTNLHYKQSNIKAIFVGSGFPNNRSKFLRKCKTESDDSRGFTVDGHEGKFMETQTIHEKVQLET